MTRADNVLANIREAEKLNIGYGQDDRWTFYNKQTKQFINNSETDCSALTSAIYHKAGYPIDLRDPCYTGNAIEKYTAAGLVHKPTIGWSLNAILKAIKPGDALLGDGHIMIYAGDGQFLSSNQDENGNILGGRPGDQTGGEVNYRPLWSRRGGWIAILAIPDKDRVGSSSTPVSASKAVLKVGSTGSKVKEWQAFLKKDYPAYAGKLVVDGVFGQATLAATKEFQRRSGIAADGIVGAGTDAKADGFSL